jgi:hypothetical protein
MGGSGDGAIQIILFLTLARAGFKKRKHRRDTIKEELYL